jgi:hypothetical protein
LDKVVGKSGAAINKWRASFEAEFELNELKYSNFRLENFRSAPRRFAFQPSESSLSGARHFSTEPDSSFFPACMRI